MIFQDNISQEEQDYLLEALTKYENEKNITPNEKKELDEWVSTGNDPYTNGSGYCFDSGYQMDFVEALRTWDMLYKEHNGIGN